MDGLIAVNAQAEPQPLTQYENDISRTQQQVSAPQPAGFHDQTEKPLEPAVLHPFWRLAQGTRDKGKCGPHSQNRHFEPVMELIGPGFLPGAPQSHENDLRPELP